MSQAAVISAPCGILVVDDDAGLAGTLKDFLEHDGYAVEVALSAAEAISLLEQNSNLSMALIDLVMPMTDGLALMEQLHKRNPDLPVVIMTGFGTIETAVEAIKRGAEDYLTKPFDREAVRKKVGRLMEVFELRRRVAQLESNLQDRRTAFEHLVYVSRPMQRVIERAQAVATTEASVLLLGETGTGKEMLARAIHAASRRAAAPFVAINCGALPRELVESELFGVRRGAFTGAYADTPGVFVAAGRGTVFLDEIGEMPKEAQVKLLRVLQEGELRPVGSAKPVQVDVRVISATNRPLNSLRSEFLREDLYFRIATVVIEIPPLRERPEDVLVLAQHFAARLSDQYGRQIVLNRGALELLLKYPFPGNVRELENLLESATALSRDNPQLITEKDLKPLLTHALAHPVPSAVAEQPLAIEDLERIAVERALRLCDGNRTRAARLLGISRDTLYRRLKEGKQGA
ncbi:MAG: sigma-54-dependent transcriptional regulator [Terriglobales bacterium]